MDDIQPILTNSIKHLPPLHAVLDLLSTGVCVRCVLRLFGVTGRIYSSPLLSPSSLLSAFQNTNHDLNVNDSYFCGICLGVLQFSYTTEGPEMSVKRYEITEFISSIAESIKRDGHEFGSFALEISVPQIILANERAIWVYLKRKYESESWFQEKLHSVHVSLKDALKQSMLSSLESLLDAKLGEGSLHIQMKYTDSKASSGIPESQEINQSFKRRKTGTEDNLNSVKVNGMACADFDYGEIGSVMHDNEQFKSPPERVKEPCHLTCHCYRTPLYIGGRYLKYSRNVSQTRWIIDEERKGEASVEEIIGNTILPFCRGDNYKFHAAGREDIDVRMLGSGRPFLIEVQNARHDPSNVKLLMAAMEEKINSSEVKLVRVKNVSVVGIEGWNLMREGETEKQKQYAALVWISRSLTDEDMQTISSFKDLKILQRTPVRVLHRRSPLDREKIIHWMKIEKIVGSTQYFLLHLCTQAGTYIKEFVHGDLGRTEPSVGSILGCRAEILQLDVTDVKMDCFN